MPTRKTAEQLAEDVSALRVQRDSHRKKMIRAETENRLLRRHQKEVRDWLAESIEEWVAVKDTEQAPEVAHKIHQRAQKLLDEAQRLAP